MLIWLLCFIVVLFILQPLQHQRHRLHPQLQHELIHVKQLVQQRTQEDVEFYRLTYNDVTPVFLKFCRNHGLNCSKIELQQQIYLVNIKAFCLKYFWGRPRPWVHDRSLLIQPPSAAESSPSYPSGHAMQAQAIANYLSQKYPKFSRKLNKLASECGRNRVIMGLHFPSDLF